jgi:hypothetical protein
MSPYQTSLKARIAELWYQGLDTYDIAHADGLWDRYRESDVWNMLPRVLIAYPPDLFRKSRWRNEKKWGLE